MKNKSILITIVVAIIVGAIAFFGGMKYQQTKTPQFAGQFFRNTQGGPGGFGQGGQRGGNRGFGGATVGEVVSQDASSITLKLMDGSSKIVNTSSSTTYSKTDTAAKTDIKTGARIAAIGTSNSDGSITAQNIQLNPMFRIGPRASGMPQPSGTK
jgi:type 1 fimbria pilin